MIEFDKKLWKNRAIARANKASKNAFENTPQKSSIKKEFKYITAIEQIVAWCNLKGISVQFGKKPGGSYHAIEKSIIISGRASPIKQAIFLLHECGHHLIGFDEADERFGLGYPKVDDPKYNSTFQHKLACLEEEIEAWTRGWRLSKRLELKINREDYDNIRTTCLKTYIQWANGKKFRSD